MLKLIGIISICFSSVLLGLHLTEKLKVKVTLLQSIISSFRIFIREINYQMPMLSELFELCSELPTAEFTDKISTNLTRGKTLEESVHIAFENSKCLQVLSKEEGSFIINTFSALGGGDCESQLAILENAVERAEVFLKEAVENKNKNSKVYLTTSIYTGIAVAIILI